MNELMEDKRFADRWAQLMDDIENYKSGWSHQVQSSVQKLVIETYYITAGIFDDD